MQRPPLAALWLSLCLGAGARAEPASLFDVCAQALEADPRLRIARLQVETGKARRDGALGQLLPQVLISAQYSDNEVEYEQSIRPDESYQGERYSLQVRQALFDWARLSRRAWARQDLARREAELLDAMNKLLVTVSHYYFAVLLADSERELILAERELVEQQLRQAEELFERKLVRVNDLLETRARADSVRTDVIDAENSAALAREALSELTGERVDALLPIRADYRLPELEHGIDHWTGLAMANNPWLRSKREAALVAESVVREQEGGHFPSVGLVYVAQSSDVGFDNLLAPERDTRYVGLDISVPVFSGGSVSATVREAWSRYYIAREEVEQARREVVKSTREAWLNARSGRKRIDAAALSVASSDKSYEAMRKSFSYATVTATSVLEALHSRTRARRDYQGAIHGYVLSWLALMREGGALSADDLARLDEWLIAPGA